MMTDWVCDECGLSIANGEGAVYLLITEIQKVGRGSSENGDTGIDLLDLVARRNDEPHWHVTHFACAPEPDEPTYSIDVERIRTSVQAHSWTFHLYGKTWGPETNWHELMMKQGLAQDLL